jgi:hypothetical protein
LAKDCNEGHEKYGKLVSHNQELTTGFGFILNIMRYEEHEANIPQSVINEQQAWIDADKAEHSINKELKNQEDSAEDAAREKFKKIAWQKRDESTGVWFGFFILFLIITSVLFIRDLQSRHSQEKPSL